MVTADGRPALRRGTSGSALHDGVSFGETDPMVMNRLLRIVFGLIAGVVSTPRREVSDVGYPGQG
jgi:hypothetical protein